MNNSNKTLDLGDEQLQFEAEEQLEERQKIADYDIREYPVEVLVDKFTDSSGNDEADFFIPDYQRELVWDEKRQSRFIESILMNLPIPYIFIAEVKGGENDGRAEVVDGAQRMRTLQRFMLNQLQLVDLRQLTKMNGFKFSNLSQGRQRRVKRKTIRLIELTHNMDEEARREMFDRLNTGGMILKPMEQMMGTNDGEFVDFIKELAYTPLFLELCPISNAKKIRKEREEFVLRFFAYLDNYMAFDHRVDEFLDDYLKSMNVNGFDAALYENLFQEMLLFIKKTFQYGFRKNASNKSVPRIRFECMAVGAALALKDNPTLCPSSVEWLYSKEFGHLTRSDASNSRVKVRNRIHFVRDHLLDRELELEGDPDKIFSDSREVDSPQHSFFD
ncbi:hypothetical protein TUM4644_35210 [Shewanella colwelliana]|uniref:DUF262 domain-containing protein n=1 Tax=Shewanella colwelliana TaxID=23 RepID=UPI001BBB72A1|nr:DUF262 domain-containing protein [Shewanella colwelliana]GIU34075.1 hypothetical protein TUM4644_35210 [Shewanella colwelliana]